MLQFLLGLGAGVFATITVLSIIALCKAAHHADIHMERTEKDDSDFVGA